MAKGGTLRGVRWGGIPMSELIKGSSLIVPVFGPLVQVLLQFQSPQLFFGSNWQARMSCGKSERRLEPANDLPRGSRNGAHPAFKNSRKLAKGFLVSFITQTSDIAEFCTSLVRNKQDIDAIRDQCKLRNLATELHRRKAQPAQPKQRQVTEVFFGFQGARGHGNNLEQFEAQPSQTSAGAAKWREAARMVQQNENPAHKVVGGIECHQQNSGSSKVEFERVGDLEANLSRSTAANYILEIREPDPLCNEEKGQSSAISEEGVTENSVRQDLITDDLLRNGLWMDGQSTPAWMVARLDLIAEGRLQSRASYGSKDWSQTRQGDGCTPKPRVGTAREALAILKNRLQQSVTVDSYIYLDVLRKCFKQKDLLTAKQGMLRVIMLNPPVNFSDQCATKVCSLMISHFYAS